MNEVVRDIPSGYFERPTPKGPSTHARIAARSREHKGGVNFADCSRLRALFPRLLLVFWPASKATRSTNLQDSNIQYRFYFTVLQQNKMEKTLRHITITMLPYLTHSLIRSADALPPFSHELDCEIAVKVCEKSRRDSRT